MGLVDKQVYKAIDPYRFDTPPLVTINGWVPFADPKTSDIIFGVKGTNFHYWRFNAESATAVRHAKTAPLKATMSLVTSSRR